MSAVITLTTDFGLSDAYVASMKGVILSINPEARIVDISHQIPPQDIAQAAFVLASAHKFFPKGTIHIVVVDPGVGTKRRIVILKTPSACFVAPDNGVLSYVLEPYQAKFPEKAKMRKIHLPPEVAAINVSQTQFFRKPVSATFHGRDIFAPVAAYLSLEKPASDFGKPLSQLSILAMEQAHRGEDGSVIGKVTHIDSFGNVITNIREDDLPAKRRISSATGAGLSRRSD